MIKIIRPSNDDHSGDTFREMLDMWVENDFCEVELQNVNHVWANSVGDVLLYDRPTLEWLRGVKYKTGLFGNTVPTGNKDYPWFFWARHPKKLVTQINKGLKSYKERKIKSIFLGKVENPVQFNNRAKLNWSDVIDLFEMPISQGYPVAQYKYTQDEYLELVPQSLFGLCLPGYGPKCNREIELLGLGVVPIFTPGVDNTYYEPLIENKHYIKVNSPEEVKNKLDSINKNKWEEMSNNCISWYNRNCSPKGSFDLTIKIINNI